MQIDYGDVTICLEKVDRHGIAVEAPGENNLEHLFHLVNNAFVRRLSLSFRREHLRLPFYLRANADKLQCQIGALHIRDTEAPIDHALVAFLGIHLKPSIYETSTVGLLREEYAMLFAHDDLCSNLKRLAYNVS